MQTFRLSFFPWHRNFCRIRRRSCLSTKIHDDQQLPKRIVFGSCFSQLEKRSSMECWESMQQPAPPDLVILMGDNVYADEFDSVETAYRKLLANESFQKLKYQSQVIATMDDNDYTEDLEHGKMVFLDQFDLATPIDVRRQPGRGIYDAHVWPDNQKEEDNNNAIALQVLLLDVRYHAVPNDLLGQKQWQWLSEQFNKDVALRLVVSPIQILPTEHKWECWNMCPESRSRFMGKIAESSTSSSTILLSGDRHVATMYKDGNLLEVTSSSLTHTVKRPSCLDHEFDPKYQLEPYIYVNNFGELSIDWISRKAEISIRSVMTREKIQRHFVSF